MTDTADALRQELVTVLRGMATATDPALLAALLKERNRIGKTIAHLHGETSPSRNLGGQPDIEHTPHPAREARKVTK